MGYRLPLDSFRITPETDAALDPFAKRQPLYQAPSDAPRVPSTIATHVRTAMCIEPRDGVLHVFMPPCHAVEDYLDLIAAIEDTAQATKLPVVIEGYTPPRDPRMLNFSVTPDPGVIEVNVQPVKTWSELSTLTDVLYDEARMSRLTTEKFLLDGRHVGTGGGNHITLGGATPADSPFLRRPDVLRSMIAYWHNHPSMSFLFSGMFIGQIGRAHV